MQVPEPVEEFVTPMRERLGLEATQKGQAALMIRDTIRADHGVFTVHVENQHGAATATCVVNILGNSFILFSLNIRPSSYTSLDTRLHSSNIPLLWVETYNLRPILIVRDHYFSRRLVVLDHYSSK